MINFAEPKLVARYGSWVRVQVAFYDFLFINAMQKSAKLSNREFIEDAQQQVLDQGFSDSTPLYQEAAARIEEQFSDPDQAWTCFVAASDQEGI